MFLKQICLIIKFQTISILTEYILYDRTRKEIDRLEKYRMQHITLRNNKYEFYHYY